MSADYVNKCTDHNADHDWHKNQDWLGINT